jgi:ubiquinone/menaquinone biosynthesis C-methylase UbiE
MGHHTFDASRAEVLEQAAWRYRFLSAEELLWGLAPDPNATVADFGSGTGFYTDVVAPHVSRLHAVDIQPEMHEYYREKGVPENVELVTSGVDDLPLSTASLDCAFSTMTYHEFASGDAIREIRRVIKSGGRFAVADWNGSGAGEDGPPLAERYTLSEMTSALESGGFRIEHTADRRETLLVVAVVP